MIRQAIVMIALPAALLSQPGDLSPGDRIRIREGTGRRFTGTLLAPIRDSVVIERRRGGVANRRIDSLRIALPAVTYLDVSRGPRSHAGLGALVGGLGGLALGVYLGSHADAYRETATVGFAFAFGTVGAATGMLIGWISPSERWERVIPAPSLLRR